MVSFREVLLKLKFKQQKFPGEFEVLKLNIYLRIKIKR